MAIIYNTDTNEVETIVLLHDGCDFLCDVMGNVGCERSDMDDIDFELDDDDVRWWQRWAEREQRINDAIEERGADKVPNFYESTSDWEEAQALFEEFLGI